MEFYRERLPESSVLPKMHILEEHVLPFVQKWRVGCGFLGEQGAESIHAYFNKLNRTYRSIPDRVKRLKLEVVEHFLHISPKNVAAQPPPKHRHKKLK